MPEKKDRKKDRKKKIEKKKNIERSVLTSEKEKQMTDEKSWAKKSDQSELRNEIKQARIKMEGRNTCPSLTFPPITLLIYPLPPFYALLYFFPILSINRLNLWQELNPTNGLAQAKFQQEDGRGSRLKSKKDSSLNNGGISPKIKTPVVS